MQQQVCHRCKQKFPPTEMTQVTISADGEYDPWTEERVAWYRSRWKKLPRLVWLCSSCYRGAHARN
jgi:hypothetical protein